MLAGFAGRDWRDAHVCMDEMMKKMDAHVFCSHLCFLLLLFFISRYNYHPLSVGNVHFILFSSLLFSVARFVGE